MKQLKLVIILLFIVKISAYAQLEPISNKLGKYGYKDKKTGKTIAFIYDEAGSFKDNEALVRKGNMYSLINLTGKKIIDLPYPGLKYFKKGEYMFQNDTVWGIVTSLGVVMARMDFTLLYKNGIIPNVYVATKGTKVGMFSTEEGVIFPMEYECDELRKVFCWDGDLYFEKTSPLTLGHNGKWGVMEMHGKIIVPFIYDHLKPVSGYLKEPKGYLGASKNGKCGLIEYTGREMIPFDYDFFLGQYENKEHGENDPYVFMKNGKIVFYDLAAKQEITKVPPGDNSYGVSDCCVLSKQNKKGVVDTIGNILVPFEYEFIEFGGGKFSTKQSWPTCRVYKGNTCGLYLPGEGLRTPMLECRNLEYGTVDGKGYYIRYKGDECAVLDSDLKVLMKFDFKDLSFLQNKIVTYDKDGKQGTVSLDGKITWE